MSVSSSLGVSHTALMTTQHFARSACSRDRLEILNSPFNAYFQARFLACSSATTEFCFLQVGCTVALLYNWLMRVVQDDDYLVRTDVIRSLYTHLISSPNLTTVHLLPPHEHLSTALRTTFSQDRAIHTGFAWLGHGALLRRSASSAFLNLLGELRVSDWEMKMADNYYTILSNQYPAVWMDDGIPLDGTGAFTVGTVGDERNWDHIVRHRESSSVRLTGTDASIAILRAKTLLSAAARRVIHAKGRLDCAAAL